MRLKVLSYNIHRGLSSFKRQNMIKKIHALLHQSDADIICLQEVWRSDGVTETELERLCNETWDHHIFGKNAVFPKGHQGNSILSHYYVKEWTNVDITHEKRETRGFLYSKVNLSEQKSLGILCCHLGLKEKERLYQAHRIREFIKNLPVDMPLIMAGDFNDWRQNLHPLFCEELELKECFMDQHGNYAKTYPSLIPLLPLDRIYFRNLKLKDCQIYRAPNTKNVSDHVPLEATFEVLQ